ncbi:MAG: hypothetical protein R6T99_02325 [Bacteroidales bacterium]
MNTYPGKFLLWISLLLIIQGCSYESLREAQISNGVSPVSFSFFGEDTRTMISTAKIRIMGFSSGGYLIVKKFGHAYRLNFTNQLGMTYFDITLTRDAYEINHIIEELNKRALMQKIGSFFQVLLFSDGDPDQIVFRRKNGRMIIKDPAARNVFVLDGDNLLREKSQKAGWNRIRIFYEDYEQGRPYSLRINETGLIRMKMDINVLKYK